jgi:hypothetical protein
MKIYFIRTIILLITFFVVFLATTVFFDTIERRTGYYDQGIQDSIDSDRYRCDDCAIIGVCSSLHVENCL